MSLYPSSYSVGVKYPSVEWRRFVLKWFLIQSSVSLLRSAIVGHGRMWISSFFVGREGRFRYGIVVTNTCPAQGTSDTILLAVPIEISGGVLGAPRSEWKITPAGGLRACGWR